MLVHLSRKGQNCLCQLCNMRTDLLSWKIQGSKLLTASEEQEVFRQYLLGIYQSYRIGALFLFGIIILMSYTMILPVRDYIILGIIIIGLMYLIRVVRLLIIFLNRNISIFYLILYLCALEILPGLIIVKYFTGLV